MLIKTSLPAKSRAFVAKEESVIIETVSAVSESITVLSEDGITSTAGKAVGYC